MAARPGSRPGRRAGRPLGLRDPPRAGGGGLAGLRRLAGAALGAGPAGPRAVGDRAEGHRSGGVLGVSAARAAVRGRGAGARWRAGDDGAAGRVGVGRHPVVGVAGCGGGPGALADHRAGGQARRADRGVCRAARGRRAGPAAGAARRGALDVGRGRPAGARAVRRGELRRLPRGQEHRLGADRCLPWTTTGWPSCSSRMPGTATGCSGCSSWPGRRGRAEGPGCRRARTCPCEAAERGERDPVGGPPGAGGKYPAEGRCSAQGSPFAGQGLARGTW